MSIEFNQGGRLPLSLENKTLVLPAISFGNVPQLAADLLINSLQLQVSGQLVDPYVLPSFGCNAYDEDNPVPSTSNQLFQRRDLGLAIVQQRAPCPLGMQQHSADCWLQWCEQARAKKVIVLASIDGSGQREIYPDRSACIQYLTTQITQLTEADVFEELQMEKLQYVELEALYGKSIDDILLPPWPLWNKLKSSGIPATLLTVFASSEGDNTADAARLSSCVLAYLTHAEGQQLETKTLAAPTSWGHLFGTQGHTAMY